MKIKWGCKCKERKKKPKDRNWVITQYKWNSGAFVSGDGEYSDYSTVRCLNCDSVMRTKAKYVEQLEIIVSREELSKRINKLRLIHDED